MVHGEKLVRHIVALSGGVASAWVANYVVTEVDKDCHLANIIISTNPDNPGAWYKPMGSEGKKWDNAKAAYKAFMAAYTLWCMEKNW